MNLPLRLPLGLILAAGIAAPALADPYLLYDNSPDASFGTNAVSNEAVGDVQGPVFNSFTPSFTVDLSDLKLSLLAGNTSDGGSFTVSLYSDASTVPGVAIALLATVQDSTLTTSLQTLDIPITGIVTVDSGTRYWIGLDGADSSAAWSFEQTNDGVGTAGEYSAWYEDSGTLQVVGPNDDYADPTYGGGPYIMTLYGVPEPLSLAMLAPGLLAVGAIRRRRRA